MDCSLPGFSVHGTLQARAPEWAAISFSRGSSWPRSWNQVSCVAGRFFTIWATREGLSFLFSSVQSLSRVWLLHESQHARPPCPSPTPGVDSDPRPLSLWCHPAIPSWVVPFSSSPSPYQHQSLFQWVSSLHQVVKILAFQHQHQHQSLQWIFRTDFL